MTLINAPTPETQPDPRAAPIGDQPHAEFMNRLRLLRIGMMLHRVLDEAGRAPLDESGTQHSKEIDARAVREMKRMLDPDLRKEFGRLAASFAKREPGEAELRLAEAQLVGWLQGVFNTLDAADSAQRLGALSLPGASGDHTCLPGAYL
jgi:hypothetical protein